MKRWAAAGCIALAVAVLGGIGETDAGPCYETSADACVEQVVEGLAKHKPKYGASTEKWFRDGSATLCRVKDEKRRALFCVFSAVARARGIGGPVDREAAHKELIVACTLDTTTCYLGADAFAPTLEGDVLVENGAPDEDALAAYRSACNAGRADACARAAVMVDNGTGIAADAAKAQEYFWLACELDRTLCIDIAHAYEQGAKVKTNKKYARQFRSLALQREGDGGCRYGDTSKCVTYGYAYMDGTHVAADREYAVVLFKEACDSGDADGCTGLADAYWSGPKETRNRKRAAELYEQACKDDSAAACWKLGRLLLRGEKRKQDTKRAEKLFKRACDLGDQAGCNYMAKKP